jgi:hypothetical protein
MSCSTLLFCIIIMLRRATSVFARRCVPVAAKNAPMHSPLNTSRLYSTKVEKTITKNNTTNYYRTIMNCIVITDPGSVDPDDIFTLLLLPTIKNLNILGVIATHHYKTKRAQLVKLLLPNIKVHTGTGIEYSDNFSEQDRASFLSSNEMFPKIFGYPKSVLRTEKLWFPDFMRAYYEYFGKETLHTQEIEKTPGPEFLANELMKHSPTNKLKVICIAPMHDLAQIDANLFANMDLFVMGGGFDEPTDSTISVPKAGYNWGICPKVTRSVLQKLNASNTTMTLVSSELVRRKNAIIPLDTYNQWLIYAEKDSCSLMTKAIMKDWLYCNKGNKLTQHKNLCDVLTLFLAVGNSYKTAKVHTTIDDSRGGTSYLDTKDLITMKYDKNGNTNLVVDYDETVNKQMVEQLEKALFTHR